MATVALTEVLATVSLATDIASGFALEKGLRTCIAAVAVAEIAGLEDDVCADAFQAALLRALGCTSHAPENADHFDDDVAFLRDLHGFDPSDPATLAAFFAWAGPQQAPVLLAHFAAMVLLRRAGLVHDLGRISVPTGIWERPGALSAGEEDRVRLHPYWSERVLARAPALAELAPLAGAHHERLDGSGYHRGQPATALSREARLLAVADVMHALCEERPHRPAHAPAQAAALLESEARGRRLDPEAVAAVIEAAGLKRPRRAWPADLTDREVDVLRLTVRGLSNQAIADELVVSARTVQHHLAHIYDKTGRRTRGGAAIFAMEHGLTE